MTRASDEPRPLWIARPPKRVSERTDAELTAWSRKVYEEFAHQEREALKQPGSRPAMRPERVPPDPQNRPLRPSMAYQARRCRISRTGIPGSGVRYPETHANALEAEQLMASRPRFDAIPLHVRQQALARAGEVGASQAAKELGLNASTVRGWMHSASKKLKQLGREIVLTDDKGAPLPWAERRPLLLDAFSTTAAEAIAASREAVSRHKAQDAKNYAVVAAIASEKSILLSGEPTSRSEQYSVHADAGKVGSYRSDLDQKIETMLNEMEAKGEADETAEQKYRMKALAQEASRYEAELLALEAGGGDDDRQQAPEGPEQDEDGAGEAEAEAD